MNPPLGERLRWSAQDAGATGGAVNRAVMARTFGYLFGIAGTGGLIGLLTVQQSRDVVFPIILISCLLGMATAALFFIVWDRMPLWAFHALLLLGIALLAVVAYSDSPTTVSAYAMTYLWVAVLAFSFFERRYAMLHVALIGVAFALVLRLRPDVTSATVHWARLMIAILVAGLVIDVLRKRLEALVARMGEVARTDWLTGLVNRRGFEERLAAELARARRSDEHLGLVLLDLDRFKQVNDRLGHEAGDRALKRLAAALRDCTRGHELAARLGGEEFVILALRADAGAACALAERAREGIKRAFAREPMHLTASCGVASFPEHGLAADALLQAADVALYEAKQLGRDRAVIAPLGLPSALAHGAPSAPAMVQAPVPSSGDLDQ